MSILYKSALRPFALLAAVCAAALTLWMVVADVVSPTAGVSAVQGVHVKVHARGRPVARTKPKVTGTLAVGHVLHVFQGRWEGASRFRYRWQRCDARGARCKAIGARRIHPSAYSLTRLDYGKRLRVTVIASSVWGSTSATSRPTPVIRGARSPGGTPGPIRAARHYLYTVTEGSIDVFDIDNSFAQVARILLPQTAGQGIRGVAASPATHMLYVSYGGDGGGAGNGSLLAYDLVARKVLWTRHYSHGVDSMAITPDGKTIYMPDGELSSDGVWYVLDAATGDQTGRIDTRAGTGDNGPHNTIVGLSGRHVYLGDRNSARRGSNYLYVASTRTNHVTLKVGPFLSGIRPFTVNRAETLVYTSVTGLSGFQVGSLRTGRVLYTEHLRHPRGASCPNSGASNPSHGISLSPDGQQLYVLDWRCNYVDVFDVSRLPSSAPVQVAAIPVHRFNPHQSPCTYDCLGDGWLLHSSDGRYVFVGDSGDVIDTTTRRVVAHLTQLYNTRVYLEIDWNKSTPVFTTTRSGLGR